MKITGTKRWAQRLEAMPRAVRKEFEDGLEEAAEQITAMQRRHVPVDEGDLRDSIEWERGRISRRRRLLGTIRSMDVRNLSVTIFTRDFKARFVEFGTVNTPPRPFFFSSYRALKRRIVNRIRRRVNKAIRDEARKRNG